MAHRAGDKPITAADASKQRGARGDRCANAIGVGVAVPVVALATWLSMQPAEALTPLDSQQPEPSSQQSEPPQESEVLAYASVRHRSHRLLHHARRHRRQENQEAEAHAPTPVAATTQPQPQAIDPWFQAPVSALQVVLITQDGRDPFERCMAAYYWSHFNHSVADGQVFEPTQRSSEDPSVTGTLPARALAETWVSKSVSR